MNQEVKKTEKDFEVIKLPKNIENKPNTQKWVFLIVLIIGIAYAVYEILLKPIL